MESALYIQHKNRFQKTLGRKTGTRAQWNFVDFQYQHNKAYHEKRKQNWIQQKAVSRLCQETDQDSQECIAWRLSFGTHVPRTS